MATEQHLRQQLAAAYRLAALFGWEDTLYTHFSVAPARRWRAAFFN